MSGLYRLARKRMERFPLPYILTCCHNSLCAVGGTINADDHAFGLPRRKIRRVFVPPHVAVIHQYVRETVAGGGKMLLGSDSHTRYARSVRSARAVPSLQNSLSAGPTT